ncbi:type II secretion system protein GspD [Aporhodopirellula aestuarii]|uniref:General secretion pathway protein GspD n=1 Tax=Aporhodopirellula aestuarii TaxID=2950107 RepID=A0ABT0TXY9_9BACT|nr:general secretion pathway protein GspD [Aporhodopirellula aestuarii]MCM2369341.1 general secretion pathway protein GspD [Aporhodopirellula aestuarii]
MPLCLIGCLFVLTPTASGQFTLPGSTGTPSGNDGGAKSITSHLQAIDAAVASGKFTSAVQSYRAAHQIAPSSPELRQRYDRLVARGIDGSLLNLTPINPVSSSLDAIDTNQPTAPVDPQTWPLERRQQETRRLTAMGRTALDRGDVRGAYQYATAAQRLGLAQHEFNPGDARPWQLLLDVQSVARRSGLDLNQLAQTPIAYPNNIAQTNGVMPIGQAGQQPSYSEVSQAGGTFTPGGPSNVQQVQATASNFVGDNQSTETEGERLFEEGMQLLSAGKQSDARAKFVKAWEFEADMSVDTRRALQDKLTLLQPARMPMPQDPAQPLSAIEKADLAAAQQVKRLYREITSELAKANEKKTEAPLEAVNDLERLARKVEGANIDEASRASLGALVGRALAEQQRYVEANRAKIDLDLENERIRTEMSTEDAREARIDQEISLLVDSFNDLMDQKRYQEAEVIAKQVGELKPDSTIAMTMFHNSRTQVRLQMDEDIRADSENGFARTMLDIGRTAVAPDPDRPFQFADPKDWEAISRRRLASRDSNSRLSIREQEIKRKLETDVELKYRNSPLGEVLDDLSAVTGVPIVLDQRALSAIRVSRDTPVSKSISSRLPLKSALNILLEDLDLTYVLQNDVLNVTSREARRTMTFPRTYRVADLVTPIPNFISGYEHGLAGALKSAYQMIRPTTDVQVVPVSMTDLGGGMANNAANNLGRNMLGQYNPMGSGSGFAGGLGTSGMAQSGRGGGSMADFDSLMQLIQQTIEPDSWEALGGVGTMAPYPQNLSLVISTTSDVHDQIVDLLESLRRLQNLQITIEVRFITLADTFFEQIGIDFDVRFDDNAQSIPADDSGSAVTIGLDAQGIPTADLDIRFDQQTISGAVAPFGGDTGSISTIGFAILSDIEAFFFLQAAQGDNRSNIMQAPKVTLFDGQIASINDTVSRPFVTSIVPVVGDFAVAQQPVIVVLDEGTRLNVQGVVSDDKRFVRLTLVPTFSQIGEVNTFTYEGSRTTRNSSTTETDTNGDGVIDEQDENEEEDIIQGTTVQQPTFASTSVSTTVSVPDGGTILLGGIKRMSEGRNERGVPFLSKIPYVSRLFRNTGVGRTSTSLMLMVTPRIIIQEEEEIAQTGFDPRN